MDSTEIRKLVPPAPLQSFYIQPDEPHGVAGEPRYNQWPGFGFEGACADRALSLDSPEAMQWCIDCGIVNSESKTLYNTPLRKFAQERGYRKVAALLSKLGWPE